MANNEHLELLKGSWQNWNEWKSTNFEIVADLTGADLREIDLSFKELKNVDLSNADLSNKDLSLIIFENSLLVAANLSGSNFNSTLFHHVDFSGANFRNSKLIRTTIAECIAVNTDFSTSNFTNSYLHQCDFSGSEFIDAEIIDVQFIGCSLVSCNFSFANLYRTKIEQNDCSKTLFTKANLTSASLINVCVQGAYFWNSRIFGLSAWEIKGVPENQSNLIITQEGYPVITVDDLQVAQFIYLLLNNSNIKNAIDTITSKAVLILGRFTEERKAILDAIYEELREQGFLPILFDFSGPQNRDITETVSTLAHLSSFVIADITDAKSIPQELQIIVPNLPSVPVQPIILASQCEYGMFEHFKHYPWVLPTFMYKDVDEAVISVSKILLPQILLKLKELK
jgi:uncharacterized protein YjbI with pentapeptide repeats